MPQYKILLVDDDRQSLEYLFSVFAAPEFEIHTAQDGSDAISLLRREPIDLVISEIQMKNVDGYELCKRIRIIPELKHLSIVFYSSAEEHRNIERKEIFVNKPSSRDFLLGVATALLSQGRIGKRFRTGQAEPTSQQLGSEEVQELIERNARLQAYTTELEQQLIDRTQKFVHANEEFLASNEELVAANEELSALNDQLSQANDEIKNQAEIIVKQKEEALQRAQQNLSIIFENTKEGICVVDREGSVLFFNRMLEELSVSAAGNKPRLGIKLWHMTSKEREPLVYQLFQRTVAGEVMEWETTMPFKGTPTSMQTRQSPVSIDGRVEFVTLTLTDITEKKLQAEQLRKSEFNLRTIFENTADSFTLIDDELRILVFNKVSALNALNLFGKEMRVGDSVLDYVASENHSNFLDILAKASEGQIVVNEERIVLNGAEKWLLSTIKSVVDDKGIRLGYCLASHNITSIKNAELEVIRLNKSLLDFQQAIDRSSIVSRTDKAGIITSVNDNFVAISGYARNELLGQDHRMINSGHHGRPFWLKMWKTISSGNIWREQVKNRRKDGTIYWVDTFIMPFIDAKGEVTEYLSIRHDITDRKRDEEELIQKRILLEEAARVAKIGYWVRDIKTGQLSISSKMLAQLNIDEDQYRSNPNSVYRHIHPEDAVRVPRIAEMSSSDPRALEVEYRILNGDGSVRWINQKADFNKLVAGERKVIGVVQDITERKMTEEMLRVYNERFDFLSKATNDAIWDLDVRLDVIEWNHAIFDAFGYDPAKIQYTGKWWEQRIHPQDLGKVMREYATAVEENQNTWSAMYRYACADGSYKHVFNRCYIIYEGKVPVRVIGALQDITDRVKATEEIEKLSLVASKTNNGVMITDGDGLVEWVNESFERMTGYSLEEIKGQTSQFLQGEETDKLTLQRISQNLRQQKYISEEVINYTKGGVKFWVKLDIAPVFDDARNVRNYIAIQTDITAMKAFQESITSIARELSSLIENANVPIFGMDILGNVSEWNQVTAELTGYTKSDTMGKKWNDVLQLASDPAGLTSVISAALTGVQVSNFELPLKTKDQKTIILLISASVRRTVNQKITGVIFVGQNITELIDYRLNLERKVAERTQELYVALEKEKEVVKIKNQFVAIASHEFRTPLTSIAIASGFIKKYKDKLSSKEIDDKILSIEKQVQNMTFLLDDILMVGKADAGKMEVILKPMEISQFIQNVCEEVRRATGNTHRLEVEESIRYKEITCDEKLLRNIFINLLTNAIKFSPGAESVLVSVRTVDEDLVLKVRDFGIGIPENDIRNLFEPFFRGGNVRSIQGTGLGLAIIKKAVDLLNGTIKVDSVVGKGTAITVQIPV